MVDTPTEYVVYKPLMLQKKSEVVLLFKMRTLSMALGNSVYLHLKAFVGTE